jgi:hypothetical protein
MGEVATGEYSGRSIGSMIAGAVAAISNLNGGVP